MTKHEFLQVLLDITTRKKKHEFVQQLSRLSPLPDADTERQCRTQHEING